MREFSIFFALFILTMCCVFGLIKAVVTWECDAYEQVTGKATKTAALSCFVQDGASWYSWEEYRYRLAAKGEMK